MFTEEELKQLSDALETIWRCGQVGSSQAGINMLNLQAKIQKAIQDGVPNRGDSTGSRIGSNGGTGVDVLTGDEGMSRDVQGSP